jgi:hypothetical protein
LPIQIVAGGERIGSLLAYIHHVTKYTDKPLGHTLRYTITV